MRLTWSLTPHSPAEEMAQDGAGDHQKMAQHHRYLALLPSRAQAAIRLVTRQDLLLSRTMLGD